MLILGRTSIICILAALTLSGCALNIQTYPGAARPATQVAKLRPLSAQILAVDGTPVKKCGGQIMKHCNVYLLPGVHSVQIQPMSIAGDIGPGYISPTVATPAMYVTSDYYYAATGPAVISQYAFIAGHSYSFYPAKICFTNPNAKSPQSRAEPSKGGLCLFDETVKLAVHAK